MRIHELAKELGTKSKDLVEALAQMGYEGLTASSSVPDEAVPRLRASGGKAVPSGRPKVVTEEPLPTRRRRKPAPEESAPAPTAEAPGDGEATTAVEAPPEPAPEPAAAEPERPAIRVPRGIILKELAERLDAPPTDLIKKMLELGEMVTITQSLS
ncbi:MAG TPA: translation initiation factor IF-2 N-terminal domain-containing protein, partial [Actinomycetota bacterium]|nr:translation initiation factor IF-2 N-terminal domain-containing protein [Actinomycetota bacterium]